MLETGLPYDFDIMEQIEQEGAIVDLSQTSYPNITDVEKTTLIYLRNTDLKNIDLDFSKLPYESKEKFLLIYLNGNIEYSIDKLNETYIKLLAKYKNIDIENTETILTEDEENTFIEKNKDFMEELNCFVYSLPLFSISRLNTDDFTFNYDDIEKSDYEFNSNICFLISNPRWNIFYEEYPNCSPKFYNKMFTENNNKLFETVMRFTPFSVLLYGMNNPEEWEEFTTMLKSFKEE